MESGQIRDRGSSRFFAVQAELCFFWEITKEVDRLLNDWIGDARRDLLALMHSEGSYAYKKGARPCVEPSVLAWLGLIASGDDQSAAADRAGAMNAANWMVAIQHADGSLPVAPEIQNPAWTTSHALLLWSALSGFDVARHRAGNRLLRTEGRNLPRNDPAAALFGHDVTAVGWPWALGTHSWVEPTAMAIVALCHEGLSSHTRVAAGIHLLLDRSLKRGGWNYGNSVVFGRELRPQPGPTGLALLALATRHQESPECRRGIDYLRATLGEIRACVSLSWGVLGLRAWNACPRAADRWLAESYRRFGARRAQAAGLGLLLLAAAEPGLELLLPQTESVPRDRDRLQGKSPAQPERTTS
jgi:hypothetical protein